MKKTSQQIKKKNLSEKKEEKRKKKFVVEKLQDLGSLELGKALDRQDSKLGQIREQGRNI